MWSCQLENCDSSLPPSFLPPDFTLTGLEDFSAESAYRWNLVRYEIDFNLSNLYWLANVWNYNMYVGDIKTINDTTLHIFLNEGQQICYTVSLACLCKTQLFSKISEYLWGSASQPASHRICYMIVLFCMVVRFANKKGGIEGEGIWDHVQPHWLSNIFMQNICNCTDCVLAEVL